MNIRLAFEDIEIGHRLNSVVRKVTQESINDYAEAVNDFNPIYVDHEFAESTVFGGTIAHVTTPIAFITTLLNENFGTDWAFGSKMDVAFKNPIRPGDTVYAKSVVLDKKTEDGKNIIKLSIFCENQKGEAVAKGKATISL